MEAIRKSEELRYYMYRTSTGYSYTGTVSVYLYFLEYSYVLRTVGVLLSTSTGVQGMVLLACPDGGTDEAGTGRGVRGSEVDF